MARTRRKAYTPLHSKPFVWIDTETTGLDDQNNDVIEFAAIRLNRDGTEDEVLHVYINMERPENAHPKALEVNGYTPEMWKEKGALDPADAWQKIADSGILEEAIIAGQNVRFDAGFLNASFKRHGIDVRMDYHLYDTCTLALEHIRPWMTSISLVPCCIAMGVPMANAHTAIADARMAMELDKAFKREALTPSKTMGALIRQRLDAWADAGKPKVWPPTDS